MHLYKRAHSCMLVCILAVLLNLLYKKTKNKQTKNKHVLDCHTDSQPMVPPSSLDNILNDCSEDIIELVHNTLRLSNCIYVRNSVFALGPKNFQHLRGLYYSLLLQ